MSAIFNALPGLEVPVSGISKALAHMWTDSAAQGRPAPARDEVKATQVNLVLHLGFGNTVEDALGQFRSAVAFSSRYPSRVVVLCPKMEEQPGEEAAMRAKIYGECFLGRSKGDTRCCEFVILHYTMAARRFLESQVSICLASDLPLYYWVHRFTACHRLADYTYLLGRARRLIFDLAHAPAGTLEYPWPNPGAVRDLAYARMLPVRQSIGQFLSRYTPQLLSSGLTRVVVSHEAVHAAEGQALMRWVRARLTDCGAKADVLWEEQILPHKQGTCFALAFDYGAERRFEWRGNCDDGVAGFKTCFGGACAELPSHIRLLDSEQALSEAMFF